MLVKNSLALCILLASCQIPGTKPSVEERIGFTVPAAPWTLTLPKGDFIVERQWVEPDGRSGIIMMKHKKKIMTINFRIEPVSGCKDSKSCRDMVYKRDNYSRDNAQNIVQSEIGGVSYVEFFIPSFRGELVQMQNMTATFVKDGFLVELHIVKALYKPEEHEMFERIIKLIKFEPKSVPSQRQE
jgi:hypothetical protein